MFEFYVTNMALQDVFPRVLAHLTWQVSFQIHAVMEEPQHLDGVLSLAISGPKHNEVAALATLAGDMKSPDTRGDVGALFSVDAGWASSQCLECG